MFAPSKTGKNGLNFIRAEDENNLILKEQPEEIIDFFKLIYVLLQEPYQHLSNTEILPNLKNNLFSKVGADSFSKLYFYFLESLILNLIAKVTFTEDQYHNLVQIYNSNPKILSSSDFLKVNRSVSYMTFIVKELFDFYTARTNDGIPIFRLKEYRVKIQTIKDLITSFSKIVQTSK